MVDAGCPAADLVAAKRELRVAALARRAERPSEIVESAAAEVCRIALSELVPPAPSTVALYVSLPGEPGTGPLLAALRTDGHRVLLPVLRDDLDLDWAEHTGKLQPGPRGTREPPGTRLGVEAVGQAAVVLVPGLLVGRDGTRLGRGGGSYDRALARRAPDAVVAMVCFPDEIVDALPAAPHDARVDAALTPVGLQRLGGPP